MSELVVVDPLPLKSALALLCSFFWFAFVFWSCRVGECRTSLPSRAISPCRGFVELALEIPEIAGYLKMDEHGREEILKYFYLRAGGSFRELQLLLKNAAKANASDAQGIKGEIDQWYQKKIQPIKDVLAETEEEEEEEEERWLEKLLRELRGEKKPKKEPEAKYLDYVTKVAGSGEIQQRLEQLQDSTAARRDSHLPTFFLLRRSPSFQSGLCAKVTTSTLHVACILQGLLGLAEDVEDEVPMAQSHPGAGGAPKDCLLRLHAPELHLQLRLLLQSITDTKVAFWACFGQVLWGVKGDALSTFSASTWGLILPKAVRSASSWGFVVGLKHGTGCG